MSLWSLVQQAVRGLFRQAQVSAPPRKRRTCAQQIEDLEIAIRQGDLELKRMRALVPPNPACCASCWLSSQSGYDHLLIKQDRRKGWLRHLQNRQSLGPTARAK